MNANFATATTYRDVATRKPFSVSTLTEKRTVINDREIGRLIAAAVINKRFCDLLLSDPSQAITQGFQGESFHIAGKDRELILSIKAKTLSDFAQQLANYQHTGKRNDYHRTDRGRF